MEWTSSSKKASIYPLKGYGITVPVITSADLTGSHISITDLSRKFVYERLVDQVRGRIFASHEPKGFFLPFPR
jgi:hypothetical protein